MRKIIILSFLVLVSSNILSQKVENNTLSTKSITRSNWAIRLDAGHYLHQSFNQDITSKTYFPVGTYSIYYKNFFLSYVAASVVFENIIPITLTNQFSNFILLPIGSSLDILNLEFLIGYTIDFNKRLGADCRAGINISQLKAKDTDILNSHFASNFNGGQIGLGLNTYFHLGRFNYLLLRLGVDYQLSKGVDYYTDFTSYESLFPYGSMRYSVTLAYKGWFKKRE